MGRLMSPDFAVVRPEMTIAEAMKEIRRQAPESETLNMIYVVDMREGTCWMRFVFGVLFPRLRVHRWLP